MKFQSQKRISNQLNLLEQLKLYENKLEFFSLDINDGRKADSRKINLQNSLQEKLDSCLKRKLVLKFI